MDLARPYADALPGIRGLLLATLVEMATPITVRALARHAGVSPQGALDVVHDLDDAGLVTLTRAGSALLVALNRDHLAAGAVATLVRLRGGLIERLREQLALWPDLAGAWLYGSAARGDGDRRSDIDLLLVALNSTDSPRWTDATDALRDVVRRWTGNEAQLTEHDRKSFTKLVKARSPLIAAVRVEGVPLTGGSNRLMRGAA